MARPQRNAATNTGATAKSGKPRSVMASTLAPASPAQMLQNALTVTTPYAITARQISDAPISSVATASPLGRTTTRRPVLTRPRQLDRDV